MRKSAGGASASRRIDLGETPAADPPTLERERLRRVDPDHQELGVAEDRLELAVEVPPPGAERRQQALPDAVERHVMVTRHRDDRRDPGELVGERPRRAELMRLGAQRQVARDHHQIRPAHRCELQHPRRNRRQVLGSEMDVGNVQDVAQRRLQQRTLAYGALAAGTEGKSKSFQWRKRKGSVHYGGVAIGAGAQLASARRASISSSCP